MKIPQPLLRLCPLLAGLVLVLAGCGSLDVGVAPPGPDVPATATAPSLETARLSTRVASGPTQSPTTTDTPSPAAPEPTSTPTPPAGPAPVDAATPGTDWAMYTNEVYGVRFQYPAAWTPVPGYGAGAIGERYEGPNGFFSVNAIGTTRSLDEVAQQEAQHHLLPYGSQPVIEHLSIAGADARLILPAPDATMPGQAALILPYPRPVSIGGTPYRYFVLYADESHIRTMGDTLQFLDVPEAVAPSVWQRL